MLKVAWIDTETTGLNPMKHDVIQLSIIIEIDGKIIGKDTFFIQPRNWVGISQEALKIVGVSVEELRNYMLPSEAHSKIKTFLTRFINPYDRKDKFYPAGYNVGFDIDMLLSFFEKSGDKYYGSFFTWQSIDVLQRVYYILYLENSGRIKPGVYGLAKASNFKLTTLCQMYGIEIEAHDAASDIMATRKLFYHLMDEPDVNLADDGREKLVEDELDLF